MKDNLALSLELLINDQCQLFKREEFFRQNSHLTVFKKYASKSFREENMLF